MLEVVQKVGQPHAKEYDLNELVEKFRKRFPPEFHGIEDPALADEWLSRWRRSMKSSSARVFSKCS